MPIKNRYETLALGDVETFLVWRNQHLTCIVAKCYGAQAERSGNIRSSRVEGGGLLNLWNNPEQKVLNINSALVADIDDICALLNRTLEVYRAEEK